MGLTFNLAKVYYKREILTQKRKVHSVKNFLTTAILKPSPFMLASSNCIAE